MSFYLVLPFHYQFLSSQYMPALLTTCAPTDTICCKNPAYFIHPKGIYEPLGPTCDTLHLHSSDTINTTFVYNLIQNLLRRQVVCLGRQWVFFVEHTRYIFDLVRNKIYAYSMTMSQIIQRYCSLSRKIVE